MSPNKGQRIIKYCVIISTVSLLSIVIEIIPITRKATYWNRCINKTVEWINLNENNLKNWDQKSKETLAVAVCNGAVYETETTLKKNK